MSLAICALPIPTVMFTPIFVIARTPAAAPIVVGADRGRIVRRVQLA